VGRQRIGDTAAPPRLNRVLLKIHAGDQQQCRWRAVVEPAPLSGLDRLVLGVSQVTVGIDAEYGEVPHSVTADAD